MSKIAASAVEDVGSKVAGAFNRPKSKFRNWITNDGSSEYPAEAGRYHLYIANNCPWCHRARLARGVLGLKDVISMDVVYYRRDAEKGWQFKPDEPGCTEDSLFGKKYIRDIYAIADPETKEKSVPILWDKKTNTIVSNESAEIIRMFNNAFKDFQKNDIDLYPEEHRAEIDEQNAWIYQQINNGAYKAGFSKSQEAYEPAYHAFFDAFDRLEEILSKKRYLTNNKTITESDLRLFPTIYRFDHVYYVRMKLNKKMLCEYPNLGEYVRDVYQYPGIADECDMDHCKKGYFGRTGNNIVPLSPAKVDLNAPHSRAEKFKD